MFAPLLTRTRIFILPASSTYFRIMVNHDDRFDAERKALDFDARFV